MNGDMETLGSANERLENAIGVLSSMSVTERVG